MSSVTATKGNEVKISVILGTRPEVIKLAPIVLEARRKKHRVQVVFTDQHREIALPLLRFFGIRPDLCLDVMSPGQSLSSLSAKILHQLELHQLKDKPDFVLVQGDTVTALMGAYWAFSNRIPVAHIEAGLRTYDLSSPYPEEANRQLISRISTSHFAPTQGAASALKSEGIAANQVHIVGNTAIDALQVTVQQLRSGKVKKSEQLSSALIRQIGDNKIVLVTAHRRESFGEGFNEICRGILAIAESRPDVRIVYPVHPNPNVRKPVESILGKHPGIILCEPQPYVAFVDLMTRSHALLTDSGGIQEEGPSLKKPILVMRETTERPEGIKAGFAKLVGTSARKIHRETLIALDRGHVPNKPNPYGDGKASKRIVRLLEEQTP